MNKSQKGVTLLLAVLVASIALSVGVGIFSLLFSQLEIAGTSKDSITAYYAANSGAECALYWELLATKNPDIENPFAFTTGPSSNTIRCNNIIYDNVGGPNSCTTSPCVSGRSEIPLGFSDANAKNCARVVVEKEFKDGFLRTDLMSFGENRELCNESNFVPRLVQQGIEMLF